MLHPADEAPPRVAHQHARQQSRLAEDLEAVADAEHQPAARGVGAHRVHDPRPRGDRAAAQIIAIGEAAGQHDEIGSRRQSVIVVPDDFGGAAARRRKARDESSSRLEPGNRSTAAFSG